MLTNKKNYTYMTAEQVAKDFMHRAWVYIVLIILVTLIMLFSTVLTILFGKDDSLSTITVILMVLYSFFMIIHKRAMYTRLVNVMMIDCDLPKFMSAFMQIANKKMFASDMKQIRSWYSVAYMYCGDYDSAESVFKAEIEQEKRKMLRITAKANLASFYYMYGKTEEFNNLYIEVMNLLAVTNSRRYARFAERLRIGLEARKRAVDKDYDAAADLFRKSIAKAEEARSIFNAVTNNILLGDIELARGNKIEAVVAYGYAIQHAPQMAYVQKYIPKYEELKRELTQNSQSGGVRI